MSDDVDVYVNLITKALPVVDAKMELIRTETTRKYTTGILGLKNVRKEHVK